MSSYWNEGIEKNDKENISEIIEKAWFKSSDRKNIQANTVNMNVVSIANSSLKDGSNLPSATTPKFFLLLLVNNKGRKYTAFNAPQIIKVQLAPCQNPLTKNIAKVFFTFIQVPPLLPPRGIYR